VRIVVVVAADDLTRDRYLQWLVEQGGGGYFVLDDAWEVGGDFEWLARRVQEAIRGTVRELGVVDEPDRSGMVWAIRRWRSNLQVL
jgi:hypothetical protein